MNIEDQKEKYLLEVRCRAKKIVNILFDDHQKKILEKERGGSWNQSPGLKNIQNYEIFDKITK